MSAEKPKRPQPKGGSRKGIPNRSTGLAREAIARFVDGNADRLQGWLDEIAADEKLGPREAFRCLMDVMEYHVPKLARTEVTGENGGALIVQVNKLT
jgi:hypothetical protein